MHIYKLKWTALQAEIFSLLCLKAGEKLSQREIAILLKVSPTAVANAIKKLNWSEDKEAMKRAQNIIMSNKTMSRFKKTGHCVL